MTAGTQYLRAGEIARLVGVAERTVRRWIADRILPSAKLGGARLVARADLEGLLSATPEPTQDFSEDKEECEGNSTS